MDNSISRLYRTGNWGTESFINLLKAIQLAVVKRAEPRHTLTHYAQNPQRQHRTGNQATGSQLQAYHPWAVWPWPSPFRSWASVSASVKWEDWAEAPLNPFQTPSATIYDSFPTDPRSLTPLHSFLSLIFKPRILCSIFMMKFRFSTKGNYFNSKDWV